MSGRRATAAELARMTPGRCTRCGAEATARNGAGECYQCHNRSYDEWRERRRSELGAMERCCACARRATYKMLGALPVCGRHLKRVQAGTAGYGIFGMGRDWSVGELERLARN